MIEIDILLIGGDQDFNLHHFQKILDSKKITYRTCYTGMSGTPSVTMDICNNNIIVNGYIIKPKAVFLRPDVTTYQKSRNPAHHRMASDWFEIFIGWAMANEDIKIFNRLYYNRNKINKINTLLKARQLGIHVPETYHTNDIQKMEERNDGNWIEKPVHGGEHTKMLNMAEKQHGGSGVYVYPITLQHKMVKPEYRFWRVGDKYHAFTMDSPSLDYRENQDARVVEVPFPMEYKENFFQLTEALNLDFAAADYITDPEKGELALLEVNSGPMFTAFDIKGGNKLCGDMVDFLIG